ncbi:MAG: F0F1 ATP synthase subunit B [Chloroflexia bacterium]
MGALGIDLVSFLWQLVAFIGLIWILNRLLYRPIRRTLDERARRIRESMEKAEQAEERERQAEEEYRKRLEEARRQAQAIADEAREQGRLERERFLEQARAEAQRFLEDARLQLELERRDAARETRRRVAALTVLAAGRLIGESLDTPHHRSLIEQYVATLDRPLEELSRSLAGIPAEEMPAVQVRSAVPLDQETQAEINSRVLRALGREMPVMYSTDPHLLGGLVVQVGDQVVDLSVVRKLNDLFRELA